MLMLHRFFLALSERTSLGSEKAAVDCEWNQTVSLCSYPLLEHCHHVSVSVSPLSFGQNILWPSFHLTFYLWWDGQLGAYQHGRQHFSPVLAMTKQRSQKQTSWTLRTILDESTRTHMSFWPKAVCLCVSFSVCAVKSRAQLHGDVTSEVMVLVSSGVKSAGDFASRVVETIHPQIAEERDRKELLFCLWVLNVIPPSPSSFFPFLISILWCPLLCGHQSAWL